MRTVLSDRRPVALPLAACAALLAGGAATATGGATAGSGLAQGRNQIVTPAAIATTADTAIQSAPRRSE